MLYSRAFLIMALANFFTMSSVSTFFLFPLFITRHGGTEEDIGIMMAVFTIASILARPWISEMIDRLGRKKCYTLACLILSFLPLVYLFFKGNLSSFYIPLLFVRFIHGIGMALAFTAVMTYVADIVPKNRLNEGFGMFGVTAEAVQPYIKRGYTLIVGGVDTLFLGQAAKTMLKNLSDS